MQKQINAQTRSARVCQIAVLCIVIALNTTYILWRVFFTLPSNNSPLSLFFSVGLLLAEVMGLVELLVTLDGFHHSFVPPLPSVPKGTPYPDVDVFIATYNEDVGLLAQTARACLAMEYPDKNKVHIYLCDDGNRPAVRVLAQDLGGRYLARTTNEGAKAGNLNHALSHSNAPLIVTFDADMIPVPEFLMQTVPYFLVRAQGAPAMGFVQTPQSFYNADLFQQSFAASEIPNEQDYFYRKVQPTKNYGNTVIYGGSNTVLSRKALEEIGGFYQNSITEDFATGILMQCAGFCCYATDTPLAAGLSPHDLKSLIAQRQRWARGCIQTIQQMKLLRKKGLSLRVRISYLSAIFYWYSPFKRFFYVASPIAFAVFGVQVLDAPLWQVLSFFLPTYLLTSYVLHEYADGMRTSTWTNIYETSLFPFLMKPVLLESVGISQQAFAVTDKRKANPADAGAARYRRQKAVVFWVYIVLSVIGLFNLVLYSSAGATLQFLVVFGWICVNLCYLLMALLLVLGAPQGVQGITHQHLKRRWLITELLSNLKLRFYRKR